MRRKVEEFKKSLLVWTSTFLASIILTSSSSSTGGKGRFETEGWRFQPNPNCSGQAWEYRRRSRQKSQQEAKVQDDHRSYGGRCRER
jgi:hypothetical protein